MALDFNIVMIGFMGSGKTTISQEIRDRYSMEIVDMDEVIVEREGCSIADIFKEKGEAYFRQLETELLIELQARKNIIISCGGGVAMRDENVIEMKRGGKVVLLRATPETIYERIKDNHNRPLLEGNMNVEYISKLMEERREKYEAVADIIVEVDDKTTVEVADEIMRRVNPKISGTTRLYGLIGSPVGHSASPAMYNVSFKELGIDSAYMAFDVDVAGTKDAIAAMKSLNIGGMNVTMPCKNEVVKYMDELSQAARIIGAVNTIVNDNGKLIGHNTDGVGFVGNLKDNDVDVKGKKMVICGAGGAATAIIVQCALDGASEISIFKRKNATFSKVVELADKLKSEVPGLKIDACDIADEELLKARILDSDILVNATSVGMAPDVDKSIVNDMSAFHKDLVVCDIVYNPLETKLLKDAAAAGVKKCVAGKGMLLWQGVAAFKLYTGVDMPVEVVKKELSL